MARSGDLESLKIFLKEDPFLIDAVDQKGNTALHFLAFDAPFVVFKYLIEGGGASASKRNKSGNTPLAYAVAYDRLETVRYLIEENHANVNEVNDSRDTPLIWAASKGCLKTLKYLIVEAHADINHKNIDGNGVGISAAQNNQKDALKYLIGINKELIKERNPHGDTPLMFAACLGHTELVKYLIEEAKASISEENNDGNTPLTLAALKGHIEIVNYLLNHPKTNYQSLKKIHHANTFNQEIANLIDDKLVQFELVIEKANVDISGSFTVKDNKIILDDALFCPISLSLIQDPVIAADGVTYEKESIARWLTENNTSPRMGVTLTSKTLIPNMYMKKILKDIAIEIDKCHQRKIKKLKEIKTSNRQTLKRSQSEPNLHKFFKKGTTVNQSDAVNSPSPN